MDSRSPISDKVFQTGEWGEGGKHRAINRGLREARGELFFIVDSDDYLTSDAIETIEKRYESIQGDESLRSMPS